MNTIRHLVSPLTLLLITGLIFPVAVSSRNDSGNERIQQGLNQMENRLLNTINTTRKRFGLNPLFPHVELKAIAANHNGEMIRNGVLSHNLPGIANLSSRLSAAGISFVSCGENLARSNLPAVEYIHDQFMQSPDHRKNILDPRFTHCGIAISPEKKEFYITETFVQTPVPASDSEAEFLLKEYLETWFVRQFNYRFLYHQLSVDYVRNLAKRSSDHHSEIENKKSWGPFITIKLSDDDLEKIKVKLKQEINSVALEAISLGISLVKTSRPPGKFYSVAVMLFGHRFINMPAVKLEKIFFNSLNLRRAAAREPIFLLDPKLSQQAGLKLKSFSGATQKTRSVSAGHPLIFRISNPNLVPPEIAHHLSIHRHQADRIGLSIRVLSRNHPGSDPLLVCLIFPQ